MSALRDDIEAFRRLDAEVFGVNPGSLKSHEKFRARFGFPFPLLVDPGGAVACAYGALCDSDNEVTRTVYLVDKQGIIRFAQRGMPLDSEMLRVLESLPK